MTRIGCQRWAAHPAEAPGTIHAELHDMAVESLSFVAARVSNTTHGHLPEPAAAGTLDATYATAKDAICRRGTSG